jgi:hypothetical protein
VDCSGDAAGVLLVEAPGVDVQRVAGDEAHDVPAFLALSPAHDARAVLPAPVTTPVQATRLGATGLALGLSVHHAVADAETPAP